MDNVPHFWGKPFTYGPIWTSKVLLTWLEHHFKSLVGKFAGSFTRAIASQHQRTQPNDISNNNGQLCEQKWPKYFCTPSRFTFRFPSTALNFCKLSILANRNYKLQFGAKCSRSSSDAFTNNFATIFTDGIHSIDAAKI